MSMDVVFVVMLGAALWTTWQLSQAAHHRSAYLSLGRLARVTASEGLICALVWGAITAMTQQEMGTVLMQSLLAGSVWGMFSFVARVPFQAPPDDTAH